MARLTQADASREAKKLIRKLCGPGWSQRVWENDGWHYAAHNGPVAVHPWQGKYFCLVGDGGGGPWTTPGSHTDPNVAVEREVAALEHWVSRHEDLLKRAKVVQRNALGPQRSIQRRPAK